MRRTVVFGGLVSVAVAAATVVALVAASSAPTVHPAAICRGELTGRYDVSRPLFGGRAVPYAKAVTSTRAKVVRPDEATLDGAPAGGTWLDQIPNAVRPTKSFVVLMYPAAQLDVRFETRARQADEAGFYAALGTPPFHTTTVLGYPGMAVGPSTSPCRSPGSVEFSASGERVTVIGYRDEATLMRIAQSVAAQL